MNPLITRRAVLAGTAALPLMGAARGADGFVRRVGTRFVLDGRRYRVVGANMWYGPWLGADAPFGNRDRLRRELDALAGLGVNNLRVNASAEDSPLTNSVKPAFHGKTGPISPALLRGLDYLLAEMAKRQMHAVLYLTNFWEWSGGMMTYLYWVNGGKFINNGDPNHPWPEFADMVAAFYATPAAVRLFDGYLRQIVGRTNAITGRPYRDDPTIMAWQLANEPRPGGSDKVGMARLPAFQAWIDGTARLIKSIDPNHLVSTGSEGLKGSLEQEAVVVETHAHASIDYLTAHVWPLNWGWVSDKDLPGTWAAGSAKVSDYCRAHVGIARRLGKPLVFEEFGYPRDAGYDPSASTEWRDRYYRLIYSEVMAGAAGDGPAAGSNFWGWNGSGRAAHPDYRFHPGDTAWLGDPSHEPQGWYGVFDSDRSTQAVIADHSRALTALG